MDVLDGGEVRAKDPVLLHAHLSICLSVYHWLDGFQSITNLIFTVDESLQIIMKISLRWQVVVHAFIICSSSVCSKHTHSVRICVVSKCPHSLRRVIFFFFLI